MKKLLLSLSAIAAVGALIWSVARVNAQTPGAAAPAAQPQPTRPRIALVNIATVLRKFDKAAAEGKVIQARRQALANQAKELTETMQKVSRDMQMTPVPAEKENYQRRLKDLARQKQDFDEAAQKEITELADKTIVEVYQNIKSVIEAIAVANNLELVMCYPDASSPEDDKKPAVAQLKLQTPAPIPYYHRNMDITEVVLVTLNKRHPAPPVANVAPTGAAPTGVAPVGGVAPR